VYPLQFEDVTLLMTIFVLFGDDIELMAAPSSDGKLVPASHATVLID